MSRAHPLCLLLATCWPAIPASAQNDVRLTLETAISRAAELRFHLPRAHFRPDGAVTVVRTSDTGDEALHPLRPDGSVAAEPVATAAALWTALASSGIATPGATRDGIRRPRTLPPIRWLDDATLRIELPENVLHWPIARQAALRVLHWPTPDAGDDFGAPTAAVAPGDGHVALRRDHQLCIVDRDGTLRRLTDDGSADIVYGSAAHRAEIGITRGMFWSADGRYLAFYREDLRPIAPYPYQDVEHMPPTARHGRYPMAGRADSVVTVRVCDTQAGYRTVTLEHDPAQDLYWTNIGFDDDGTVTVALVDRGQDDVELVRFDAATGERLQTLLREHDAEWLEPEHPPTFLPDGRFVWWSRRTGHRHLYLHQADGRIERALTSGDFDVQELARVAPDASRLWFSAAGDDPRQLHLFEAGIEQPGQHRVTEGRGSHHAQLSVDGRQALVTWSDLTTRPTVRLLATNDGEVLAELGSGDDPFAGIDLPQQRFFEVATPDGDTLYGHLALPPDFDPARRYPVLLYVYGGPHAQLVKDEWFGGAGTWLQAFAGEGFVVARLDNRGTPNRGIEFEQKTWRHLGTLEVTDQMRAVAWLKAQPFVDPAKVAVHGWSFGGYMTLRLMLLHPDAFACGISGAPVTDWAMYETGYTERYMDSPQENPAGYEASSCLPIAGNLKRPLLLVHGTDDRTVMWSHTLRFVDACIDAGADLEYFPYPQQLHGLRGKDRAHFLRKLLRFVKRHTDT